MEDPVYFSQQFLNSIKEQLSLTEFSRRFNLDGVEVPYSTDDEETICPHCGQPSNF